MTVSFEIVCFHAQLSAERGSVAKPLDVQMINILWRSARAHNRLCQLTVLTDPGTEFPGLDPAITVHRNARRDVGLLLSRIMSQADYVDQHQFQHPLVVLDNDIIINGTIGSVFDEDFDVAVAFRRQKKSPINSGVVLLHNRRPDAVKAFANQQLAVFVERFGHLAQWWGDQASLNAMIEVPRDIPVPSTVELHGAKVRLLDYMVWNRSPIRTWAQVLFPKRRTKILHFKSARRKPDMIRFYQRWFESRRA